MGGRKIIGSAQKRDKEALLQHGSIPLTMNVDLYAGGTRSRPEAIAAAMTTLSAVSAATAEQLCQALVAAFTDFVGTELEETVLGADAAVELEALVGKYRSQEWNFAL